MLKLTFLVVTFLGVMTLLSLKSNQNKQCQISREILLIHAQISVTVNLVDTIR